MRGSLGKCFETVREPGKTRDPGETEHERSEKAREHERSEKAREHESPRKPETTRAPRKPESEREPENPRVNLLRRSGQLVRTVWQQ